MSDPALRASETAPETCSECGGSGRVSQSAPNSSQVGTSAVLPTADAPTAEELQAAISWALSYYARASTPFQTERKTFMWLSSHLLSLIAADADRQRMGWRTKESALCDGSHILVTDLGRGGFGGTPQQDWCAVVHYWENPGEEGFYLSTGASSEIDDRPMSFTHWMPLPKKAPVNCPNCDGKHSEFCPVCEGLGYQKPRRAARSPEGAR